MLRYRWLKRESFMSQEFRKYLWYAIGEIILVVAGIFIALQIDTYYESKQTRERLTGYLENIAEGIGDDLQRLEELKLARIDTTFESYSAFLGTQIGRDEINYDWYNVGLARSASRALEKAQKQFRFLANSGSYRALESSGLMAVLQDPGIETMLYDYYRTAERAAQQERELNKQLGELSLRLQTEVALELPQLFVREPLLLWDGDDRTMETELRLEYRNRYWDILNHAVTQSLLRTHSTSSILQEYEHLRSLGTHIITRIEEEVAGVPLQQRSSAHIYYANSKVGHPVLVEKGRPQYHSFGTFVAPVHQGNWQHVYNRVWIAGDALNIDYDGGIPWAYFFLKVGAVEIVSELNSKDYSMYDRMQLQLKRNPETTCESLRLEIKDIDDAFTGGLRNVALSLTPQWQTYTVDLAEFVEADLSRVHVTAGFLIDDAPCRWSIRDIRYLRPDQTGSG